MKNQKVIRVAVIGAGQMGLNHLRNYKEMKNVNLVAVCDIDKQKASDAAKMYNIKAYFDHNDLIVNEKLDGASIVTPTIFHKKVALAFIKKGIPLLIEKPLASTSKEAIELLNTAKKHKVSLFVGHVERFNPAVTKLKELILNGDLGDILSIIIKRVGLFPPRVKDINVVTDLAIHDVDIINFLIGKPPKRILATGGSVFANKEDYAEIFLDYSPISCFIQVNWVTPIKIRHLSITGTKGYAELNYMTQKLSLYKNQFSITKPTGFEDFLVKFGEPEKISVKSTFKEPLKQELELFVKSLLKKDNFCVSGEDALSSILITEKVNQSIRENRVIILK